MGEGDEEIQAEEERDRSNLSSSLCHAPAPALSLLKAYFPIDALLEARSQEFDILFLHSIKCILPPH